MRMSPIGIMLARAYNLGTFSFDRVSYDMFLRFLRCHAPKSIFNFGKRDPKFRAELFRLAGIANAQYAAKRRIRSNYTKTLGETNVN